MKVITESVEVDITPRLMAKAFWNMDSIEQAEFFSSLAAEVKKTGGAYSYGEMQWCYLKDELKKDKEAMRMYMSLSAFAYDWWPQKTEEQFQY